MKDKVHLKVCGMRDAENILQVAELHPDYMGFIFYPKSKRFVGNEFRLPVNFPKSIKRVGVFVNEATSTILDTAKEHSLNFVQLHGDEPVTQCAELKQRRLGVIKVFSIDEHFSFEAIKAYKPAVDYFLFDTKDVGFGGTGKTFDWNLLNQYDQEIPFFLSGGLSVENSQGIKILHGMNLHALDVNSGVEISPGQKDIEKIKCLKIILNSKF